MTRTRFVTNALILATVVTVGCSKKHETPKAAAPVPAPPQTKAPEVSAVTARIDHSQTEEATATATAATVPSFADGEAAYHAKRYDEAVAIFDSYVLRRPHNGWGHYMLALSAWKLGDLTKSEQAFERALKIDPGHIKSHLNLSRVLIDQNRHAEAIDRLVHAADVDPESLEVHRLLGRTLHSQGKTEDAERAYRRALELNERDAWSLNYLALMFIEGNRPDAALPLLIQAVQLRKDVAEFHNHLGLALEHTGHVRAAATAYGSALRLDPGYDPAKQNLARVDPQY